MTLLKMPSHLCLGIFVCGLLSLVFCCRFLLVFLLLVVGLSHSAVADCVPKGELQWYKLAHVIDGDTLRLTDGRNVRVIAINTPELGRKNKPGQAFARQAQLATKVFFAQDKNIALEIGDDKKDSYGRVLAYVYRADGKSLSAELLAQGLAWQVVVPPNDHYWRCFARQEKKARKKRLGLWAHADYKPKSAHELTLKDTGFQRIEGTVISVNRSRRGWWLQLDKLAIFISQNDIKNFSISDPHQWLNTTMSVRGWVIDRSLSAAAKKHGHSPLMMKLRHPAMQG